MKGYSFLIVPAIVLLLVVETGVRAQNPFMDARNKTVSARIDGGASWAIGSSFKNLNSGRSNETQPIESAGAMYHVMPWLRGAVDYSYSSLVRQQVFAELIPIENAPAGSSGGMAYRELKSSFHSLAVTAEAEIFELAKAMVSERYALWVGIGVGGLYDSGNVWSLSATNEFDAAALTQKVNLKGHNDPHTNVSVFIPVTVSFEYSVLPQLAVGVGGGFRYIPSAFDLTPVGQAYVKAGLVYNFK